MQRTLNLYPIDYPFETLVDRISGENPKTILDPDFQRKYKWDKDGWVRASKFIESCLMRIPLPSCYFAEDDSNRQLVIDGVQRLTTIKRFFNDEFALEGMTIFKELEGKKFSELGDLKVELENTTIRCIVLRKDNSKKLIREIFARLNQGAVKLSDQEIRHAIYPGLLDNLLQKLSLESFIKNFGNNSNPRTDSRESEEQVLRFFAFSDDIDLTRYDSKLSDFLDEYMQNNLDIKEEEIRILESKFQKAAANCLIVFNGEIFTNPLNDRLKQGLVYYDLLMSTLGLLETEVVEQNKEKIYKAYYELFEDGSFVKTLSGGLQQRSSIIRRRNLWKPLLDEAIV